MQHDWLVETYCGDSPTYEGPEFAEPRQPMLIVGTNEGLRIVLSSNGFDERMPRNC